MLLEKLSRSNTTYIMKPTLSKVKESGAGSIIQTIPKIAIQAEINGYGEMVIDPKVHAKKFVEDLQGIGEVPYDEKSFDKQVKFWTERIEKFFTSHEDYKKGDIVEYVPYEEKQKRKDEDYFQKKYGITLDEAAQLKEKKEGQAAQGAS